MKEYLKNPIVIGVLGGTVATVLHYVNQKIVKKKEKVDMAECAKIFIFMAACLGSGFYFINKKKMLSSGLTGGQSAATSVASNQQPIHTGNMPNVVSNNNLASSTATTSFGNSSNGNGNINLSGRGNTISSMNAPSHSTTQTVGGAQSNLVLSDINDVIHTGMPNF